MEKSQDSGSSGLKQHRNGRELSRAKPNRKPHDFNSARRSSSKHNILQDNHARTIRLETLEGTVLQQITPLNMKQSTNCLCKFPKALSRACRLPPTRLRDARQRRWASTNGSPLRTALFFPGKNPILKYQHAGTNDSQAKGSSASAWQIPGSKLSPLQPAHSSMN
jgi:hypothetical protein